MSFAKNSRYGNSLPIGRIRTKLINKQNCSCRINTTFDGFSSAAGTSFFGMTGHWITEEWEMKKALLAFDEIRGSHSGENQAEILYKILEKYGLKDRVSEL
jgi:hypothetical protein